MNALLFFRVGFAWLYTSNAHSSLHATPADHVAIIDSSRRHIHAICTTCPYHCALVDFLTNTPHAPQVSDTALLRRVDNQRLYCRVLVTVVQNTYHMPSVVLGLFFPYPSPAAEHENILVLP